MTKDQRHLPQLSGVPFITDGGIETTLIYRDGFDLPYFAAFTLLKEEKGREALKKYFESYVLLAQRYEVGLILESATWRASHDWGLKLGYSDAQLADANRQAITLLQEIRAKHQGKFPMVISGCLGPRGDGYNPTHRMTANEARDYHQAQIQVFRDSRVDMVSAITMNYLEEALGITRAAQAADLPVVISLTVETNGRLPTGQTLEETLQAVDEQTNHYPVYYMINCAHPAHFATSIDPSAAWTKRLRGLRVNASTKSHAELDQATELDAGNPEKLGKECARLHTQWPALTVLGGCCGTDERHVEEMCKAMQSA